MTVREPEGQMPSGSLPYRSLERLLTQEPIAAEDALTAGMIKRLKHARFDGVLTREEFLEICRWKSPRSIRHCKRNSPGAVKRISREVFGTRDEETRLRLLTALHGVSVPTASAILTLTDPKRYGVIDIRVWQLLHSLELVRGNPAGVGFTFTHWRQFLTILRNHAKRLKIPVRLLELTLFRVHQNHQAGRLYPRQRSRGTTGIRKSLY